MTNKTIVIGDFTITALLDGYFEAPAEVIQHSDGEAARQRALEAWGSPMIRIPVYCFLVRRRDETMLVDAGAGTAWGPAYGKMRSELAALGVAPEQVEYVLVTHLHGDHALGLLEQGAAQFPNARVIVPRTDLDFYSDPRIRAETPEPRRGGFDIAAQVASAYAGRLVPADPGPVLPGIALVPLPGHTIGHSGYRFDGTGCDLLLWGDVAHLERLQTADPGIGLLFNQDGAMAAESRRDILEKAATDRFMVAGGHVTGFKQIDRAGAGFALRPAAASP